MTIDDYIHDFLIIFNRVIQLLVNELKKVLTGQEFIDAIEQVKKIPENFREKIQVETGIDCRNFKHYDEYKKKKQGGHVLSLVRPLSESYLNV